MTQYLSQGSLALLLARALIWGVVLGVLYSVFGIRRVAFRRLRFPAWMCSFFLHVEDFCFCVISAAGLSVLYFATTKGVLRGMAIPMMGLGFFAWRKSGGRLVEICTDALLHLIATVCKWVVQKMVLPILRVLQRFGRMLGRRYATWRARRYAHKLRRLSHRITRVYAEALVSAGLTGTLPDNYGQRRKKQLNRKESLK